MKVALSGLESSVSETQREMVRVEVEVGDFLLEEWSLDGVQLIQA